MNIIIIGCGKVGEVLASQLNEKSNDITVVDENADKVKAIVNKYDVMGVIGNGTTGATLTEAGISSADLVIAVTGDDEINLLACVLAKKAGNCLTIARVKNPEHYADAAKLKNDLSISMIINPEYAAASEISRILNFPSAINVETFAKGRIELLKFKLPEGSRLVGMKVKEVITKLRCNILVCTVERGDEALVANGDLEFCERDTISIIASRRTALNFFKKIDHKLDNVDNAIIVGGDGITHYLCELMNRSGIKLKVIEKDRKKCELLAAKFDSVTVMCGDPTDEQVLREEGVANADAFISLTSLDEENILLSLFAKRAGSKKSVTKINRIEYDDVIKQLDLDSIVYPKHLTANMILKYVRSYNNNRGSSMENLYNIIKGQVIAAEFAVGEYSPISGTQISELRLKPDVLIAAILRDKQLIIPRGQDVITPGDSVVVVTKIQSLYDITDILEK